MKKLIPFFLLFLFAITLSAQSSNADRLKSIDTEIAQAVEQGDYAKAAELKEEREIRKKIEAAIAAGDFELAASLRAQLDGGDSAQTGTESQANSGNNGIRRTENNARPEITKTDDSKQKPIKGRENGVANNGLILEFFVGVSNYQYYGDPYDYDPFADFEPTYSEVSGPSIGFKLGNKFYFGKKSNPFRIGMSVNWLDLVVSLEEDGGVSMGVVNPGIIAGWEFKKNVGMEVNYNFGFAGVFNAESSPGFGMTPQVKFRYKVLSVGFQSNIINGIDDNGGSDLSFRSFGACVGFSF